MFVDITKEQWPPFSDQVGYVRGLARYSEKDLDAIIGRYGLKVETAERSRSNDGDARPSGETDLPLPPCATKVYAEGVTTPGRSDWAHFLARHFRRRGLPENATVRLVLDWNHKNKPEPLPADKVREMVHNAYRREYTSLGCEYLPGAKEICGDRCVVKPQETSRLASEAVCMADVAPEKIEWLWSGRLPRGKFIVIIGDPGLGKSALMIDLMSRITTGTRWPDGGVAPQGDCVLLTAEDGLADTVRPRLDTAGADPKRVWVLRGMKDKGASRLFNLTHDLAHLEHLVRDRQAVFVALDPVSAYLGKIDSFRDSDIRATLAPLAAMAERTHTAVVGIMHLTKDQQRQVIHRAQGNIAFVASARAVFGVVEDKDIPDRMLFLPIKMNVVRKPPGLAYRLQDANGVVKVQWDSRPVDVDLESAFAAPEPEDAGARAMAEDFLRGLLADGRVPSKRVFAEAKQAGIADKTLWRAKARLKIKAGRDGFGPGGEWGWVLP